MNAVERVIEYTKLTPEKPPIVANHRPPQGWPSQGVVEAQDLVVRYREDLDPVLRHINFKTRPHEKIGVVGRTGMHQLLAVLAEPCCNHRCDAKPELEKMIISRPSEQ